MVKGEMPNSEEIMAAQEEMRRKAAQEPVETGEVLAPETGAEAEQIEPSQSVQADLMEEMRQRFGGVRTDRLHGILRDPERLASEGQQLLPGRETQMEDVLKQIIHERGGATPQVSAEQPDVPSQTPEQQAAVWARNYEAVPAETLEGADKDPLVSARGKLEQIRQITQDLKDLGEPGTPNIPPELGLTKKEVAVLQQDAARRAAQAPGAPKTQQELDDDRFEARFTGREAKRETLGQVAEDEPKPEEIVPTQERADIDPDIRQSAQDIVEALKSGQAIPVTLTKSSREVLRAYGFTPKEMKGTPINELFVSLQERVESETPVAPEKKEEEVPEEKVEETPESEKTPEETLAGKLSATKELLDQAKARPGSPEYLELQSQQIRIDEALSRQREVYDAAKQSRDAKSMQAAAREIDKLQREFGAIDSKMNALPREDLPGDKEPLLRISTDRQLTGEEYQELGAQISSRQKGGATPVEQALMDDFNRREAERLQKEGFEQGKEKFKEVLQQKYEELGTMAKGDERNRTAVGWAKEATRLGDMRLAQDLLSRCDDPKMREQGVRDLAVALAEEGIDDPQLLKWVELGIQDKKLRSMSQVDVMNAKQKRKIMEQMESGEMDPELGGKLLGIIGDLEKRPDMEKANKVWGKAKTALKWGGIAAGGAGAAAVGIFGFISGMIAAGITYALRRGVNASGGTKILGGWKI